MNKSSSVDEVNTKLKDLPPITRDQEYFFVQIRIKIIPNSNISVSHYFTEG